MKLKRKLVILGLIALDFMSFCVCGGVSEAKEKKSGFSTVVVNKKSKNKNKGGAFYKSKLKEYQQEMLNISKKLFYDERLDRCCSEPICCGVVSDDMNPDKNDFRLLFSPTHFLEEFPRFKDFRSLNYKIVDKKGLSCCFTDSDMEINPFLDVCVAYVPPLDKVRRKGGSFFGETISVDDGFKFEVGKTYYLEVYDSAGHLLLEDCFMSKAGNIYSFDLIKQINHPRMFNESFYRNLIFKDWNKIKRIAENHGYFRLKK